METKIIRDMYQCFLAMELENDYTAGYQQKMVLHNKMEGMLTVEERQIDEKCKFYYDITDKISIQDFFIKNKASASEVETIFSRIVAIMEEAKKYLLEEDNFVLRRDCIYLNLEGTELFLCFNESYQVEVKSQLLKLAEYFMELIDYKEEQAVTLTYGLYKVLREDSCSFSKLKDTINQYHMESKTKKSITECKPEISSIVPMQQEEGKVKKHGMEGGYVQSILMFLVNISSILFILKTRWLYYAFSNQLNMLHLIISIGGLLISNVGIAYGFRKWNGGKVEAEINIGPCYEEEGTIVISNNTRHYMLKREDKKEDGIEIQTFPFILGSSREQAQGVITYPGISKRHVMIEQNYDTFAIMDLDSTNGTFLNGEEMNAMKRYSIKEGDRITLVGITFQFMKIS